VPEPASVIARDLVAEVGRVPAISYTVGRALGARSWRRMGRAVQLVVAVLFA
jgi:hypothetical protein